MKAMHGVIVKGIGGFYYAMANDKQVYTLKARGVFRKQKITPLVGDAILFTPGSGEEDGWIDEILPRQNILIRPPVSNVSYLVIVVAPKPKPDLLLVDTLMVHARKQGILPILVINKADLDASLCGDIRLQYIGTGDPVLVTSVKSDEGLQELAILLKKGICCFAGQSGVGKSSLLTAVTGIELEVGEISQKSEEENTRPDMLNYSFMMIFKCWIQPVSACYRKPNPKIRLFCRNITRNSQNSPANAGFSPAIIYQNPRAQC